MAHKVYVVSVLICGQCKLRYKSEQASTRKRKSCGLPNLKMKVGISTHTNL